MKKILVTAIILATSNLYAADVNCEASISSRGGTKRAEIQLTYKDGRAEFSEKLAGYEFEGKCYNNSCNIGFHQEKEQTGGGTIGAFSEPDENKILVSRYERDRDDYEMFIQLLCQKIVKNLNL